MRRLRSSPSGRRCAAIALLVLSVSVVYWLTVHLWWVAPLLRISEEQQLLAAAHERFTRLEAQRTTISARLAALDDSPLSAGRLLPAKAPEAAQAQMMQLVVDRLALQPDSGLPCSVLNRVPGSVVEQGRLRRVLIDVELECGLQTLAQTLHRLENEAPLLLVEAMDIRRLDTGFDEAGPAMTRVGAQLQIIGYLGRNEGRSDE